MIKETKSQIFVKTSFEGYHRYLDAPDEVFYLRTFHRHIFHVTVIIDVFHNDRDIEFHLFKKFVNGIIKDNDFDCKSCEMIIDDLAEAIALKYPNRGMTISVSEDGENGAIKTFVVE
jgi:hypothetical protein